ncbi:MAG: hypothetical protein QOE93_322 [Actinomycetota bacterium]|jgi:hypothetical protein|nr:hypothetical protein [Actinomycetota bacterium]
MIVNAHMERRILVNYRVSPDVLAGVVPEPFRPVVVDGYGIAGICLIRLGRVRPAGLPSACGVTSENAAHRVAVEWDTPDGVATGVYIRRRDTSSRVTVAVGGRAFPGWHHRARFRVVEGNGAYRVEMASRDGGADVMVAAHRADEVMPGSVFGTVEAASAFFRCAPVGYAATPQEGVFDGVALSTEDWAIAPLLVDEVRSSFFDDRRRFPAGTAVVDSAFLMADLRTMWRPRLVLLAGRPVPRCVHVPGVLPRGRDRARLGHPPAGGVTLGRRL